MDYTSNCLESRLDWLTVTSHKGDKARGFHNLGKALLDLGQSRGGEQRPWGWRGYEGYTVKGVTHGSREDSSILQLSGALADEWFDEVWKVSDNCTRLDLAVTVKPEGEISGIISRHEQEAIRFANEQRPELAVDCIRNRGEAATLYIGRRISDLFCRIYDKGRESGDPAYAGHLRYELEVKGEVASRTASRLHTVGLRADRIRSAVYQHVVRRGIQPVFTCDQPTMRINTIRPTSDDATRLKWLAESVRPAIAKLYAAGYKKELLDALGLPRTLSEELRLAKLLSNDHHRDPLSEESNDD